MWEPGQQGNMQANWLGMTVKPFVVTTTQNRNTIHDLSPFYTSSWMLLKDQAIKDYIKNLYPRETIKAKRSYEKCSG